MIFEAEGLVFVALFLFWIWALIDCISTDAALCRNLPKPMWIILVLILPDIGSVIWLLLGRPERSSWRPGSADYSAPRRPVGLEDSPRYSPSPSVTDRRSEELDRELERWERERRERETAAPTAGVLIVPVGGTRPGRVAERAGPARSGPESDASSSCESASSTASNSSSGPGSSTTER